MVSVCVRETQLIYRIILLRKGRSWFGGCTDGYLNGLPATHTNISSVLGVKTKLPDETAAAGRKAPTTFLCVAVLLRVSHNYERR